ncbi:hypothetical protein [Neisseria chenwenguii]|uniref:Uncharacterized protein n=1 Tax=Neisseria chenwenguii TaxID=1853278 RepID=A0A220S1G0_9NEIS|nr:hypothetical protein [Neisseria chenwenguii]ASK27277.1 hypothetical protein BG910_05560 [Neisseria chenwenguii]ROV57048.1 hypothetical protein EGS38_02600 [Neisseria chenwenguii]
MKKIIIQAAFGTGILAALAVLSAFWVKQPDLTLTESIARKFESDEERKERLHQEALVREEQRRQEFLKQASCKPEKPLSKGEIYALAMQDYWKIQMNELWGAEEKIDWWKELGIFLDEIPSDINEKICQLERDEDGKPIRFGNKACYPWKLTEYDTFEKLQEWKDNGGKAENLEDLFGNEWRGEYYDPEKGFLQQPDFYNKESDFAVVQRDYGGTVWYPRDCCGLLSYDETVQNGLDSQVVYSGLANLSGKKNEIFKKMYFLTIRFKYIDYNVKSDSGLEYVVSYGKNENYIFRVFPVSSCGKVINL